MKIKVREKLNEWGNDNPKMLSQQVNNSSFSNFLPFHINKYVKYKQFKHAVLIIERIKNNLKMDYGTKT